MAIVVGIAGCRFESPVGDGFQCGVGDLCPSGTMCVDGFCVSGGPDDASVPDGEPGPDADPSSIRCGGLANLHDDFETAGVDPHWTFFDDPGATVAESGGHLAVNITAGTGSPYAGYTSAYRYDLTESEIVTEVSQIGGGVTILEARNYIGARAQLVAEDGDLAAAVYDTANNGVRNAIPYVAGDMRFWRLRGHLGTLYWEYSADGGDWNELHHENAPFDLAHVRGVISGGEQVATASEARFEIVNPGTPPAGLCGASTYVDAFGDSDLEPLWDFWQDYDVTTNPMGCQLNETTGAIQMDFGGGISDSWCGFNSKEMLALDEEGVYVDAMGVASRASFVNYFEVVDPWTPDNDADRFEILVENGGISFNQHIGGTNVNTHDDTYSATDHRYWKIAKSGSNVIFQTSPDASTWTTQFTVAPMFALDEVVLVIGAGHYNDPGSAVTTYFRGIDTP